MTNLKQLAGSLLAPIRKSFYDYLAKLNDRVLVWMSVWGGVMCISPMRSTDFKPIVEPILNEAFDGVYDQRKDEWKAVFQERTGITRSYHEEPVMFGMNAAPEMPDGMPVTYQQGGVLYTKRYPYLVYGLGYAMTQILVEDGDHISLGSIFAKQLAMSMIETKETRCANELNRAFNGSFVGGDGVALCVNNHPSAGGPLGSNVLAVSAALSQTSLEQALIQVRQLRDFNGKPIRVTPQKIVAAPANMLQCEVLLKSVLRAGTNNNDINPVKSTGLLSPDAVILSRLTSPTAWWISTDSGGAPGLSILMRRKLTKSMEGDFETDSMRYKATERYATGWTDWKTVVGTPGT